MLCEFIFHCFVWLKDTLYEFDLIWTSDVFIERKKNQLRNKLWNFSLAGREMKSDWNYTWNVVWSMKYEPLFKPYIVNIIKNVECCAFHSSLHTCQYQFKRRTVSIAMSSSFISIINAAIENCPFENVIREGQKTNAIRTRSHSLHLQYIQNMKGGRWSPQAYHSHNIDRHSDFWFIFNLCNVHICI